MIVGIINLTKPCPLRKRLLTENPFRIQGKILLIDLDFIAHLNHSVDLHGTDLNDLFQVVTR